MDPAEQAGLLARFEDAGSSHADRAEALARLPPDADGLLQALLRVLEGPPYPSLRPASGEEPSLHAGAVGKWLQAAGRTGELDARVAALAAAPKVELDARLLIVSRLDLLLPGLEERVRELGELMKAYNQDHRIRESAARALAGLAPESPQALTLLRQMREKPAVQPGLRRELDVLFRSPGIQALENAALSRRREAARELATRADADARAELRKLLLDEDSEVRAIAREALKDTK